MRKFRVVVNGTTYEVDIEEISAGADSTAALPTPAAARPANGKAAVPAASAVKKMAPTPVENGGGSVVAQMPGTITALKVSSGDEVKKGQTLVILEAMKMENEVVAPKDGTVLEIKVEKDSSVNAGDVLVILG